MREVVVWQEVDDALQQRLGEESYNSLRDRLFRNLETRYDRYCGKRHPDDVSLFVVTFWAFDDAERHRFDFQVDDGMADTHLIVVGMSHSVETFR